jgi:hypothetical protein
MKKFLDSLVPRECKRELPVECILQYDELAWEALRKRFAIIVEVADAGKHFPLLSASSSASASSPQQQLGRGFDYPRQQPLQSHYAHRANANSNSNCASISAWGFGTLIDQAFEFLATSATLFTGTPGRDAAAAKEEAFYLYGKADPAPSYFEAPGLVDLGGKHPEARSAVAQPAFLGSRNVKGSYTFQDCEAGIFFFAFEKDFRVGQVLSPLTHRPLLYHDVTCRITSSTTSECTWRTAGQTRRPTGPPRRETTTCTAWAE